MDAGKECAVCGFQGHVARYCPSPRKWRLEMEGKLSKKTRGDRYQIPHRRGSDWMRDQEKLNRGEPPAWVKAMQAAADNKALDNVSPKTKEDLMARFPEDEELSDPHHWYNDAVNAYLDDRMGDHCSVCGFQGHAPENCPSPMKWRESLRNKRVGLSPQLTSCE
ncbi:hypothetical protein ACP4OV_013596 [Aristida adscensionis]